MVFNRAVGHTLQTTRGIDAAWMQTDDSGGFTPWTKTQNQEESELQATLETRDVTGSDLAVFASTSDNVAPEVEQTKLDLPKFSGIQELFFEGERAPTLTASQAAHVAAVFRDELRSLLNDLPSTSTIHLFMAGPVEFVFSFSQQTNTLPPIQTRPSALVITQNETRDNGLLNSRRS